jgi:hypothetical protein
LLITIWVTCSADAGVRFQRVLWVILLVLPYMGYLHIFKAGA